MLRLRLHSIKRRNLKFPSPLWGGVRGGGGKVGSRLSSPNFFSAAPLPPLPHKGGGNTNWFDRYRFIPLLVVSELLFCAAPGRAEVQKLLHPCGGLQLCASYQLVLTPPDGWVIDEKATSENKVQIMVPKGQSFATAEPLIYVQVFYHSDKQQTLADFARQSNARWLAANPRSKITEMPAVERANGKPAFLRFAMENPGRAQQAYEIGALGPDTDKDGNDFVLDVVMSGSSKTALEGADAIYVGFLKAN